MLEGAFNFRDLGGLRTRTGRRLRAGRLFRSDTLQALTPADADYLGRAIGLGGIVDLRLEEEVRTEGRGALAALAQIRYANVPLHMAATSGVSPQEVMRRLYLDCLSPGTALAAALSSLGTFADRPVLFHCAAGKDRTGIVAALLLRLLDVADEDIVADYLRSAEAMPRMLARFASWPRYRDHMASTPPQVYEVRARHLTDFLDALDSAHGGARAWALGQGISEDSLRRWAAAWVE